MSKLYRLKNVLEAARERIAYLFDHFDNISVSISGGKDSSVLFHLTHTEAVRRNRTIDVVFIDQEAEYASTIDIIRYTSKLPNVRMRWYQVPFLMTNSTSYSEDYLKCWDGGEIRPKEPTAIKEGFDENHTWETLLTALERSYTTQYASLLGLRSSESLNRYRAVVKNPAYEDVKWSSKTANKLLTNFYPLYDWEFDDIWRFVYEEGIPYNKIYDYQFAKGYPIREMRVSCLIHDKSMHCIADLPEFEPDTFEWLCRRCDGIDTAMRYVKENQMYSTGKLPSGYTSWRAFKDFLIANHPNEHQKKKFEKRFATMPQNEDVCKQQVSSLLLNDWEFLNPIDTEKEEKKLESRKKWQNVL